MQEITTSIPDEPVNHPALPLTYTEGNIQIQFD